jgi:HAD superfamily hydrolase (TIGR01457 family)
MIAASYDRFLLDLDGVLFRGGDPIDGAAEVVGVLRDRGKRVVFVTNNAARTPAQVVAHLASVGIDAAEDEVETSALVTAQLLEDRGLRRVAVIGEEGLRSALVARGLEIVPGDTGAPEALAVGWDRSVDWEALRRAAIAIERGAAFIATNPDTSYPAPDGLRWPGAGAIVAALVATTGEQPEVVGKPHAPLLEAAARRAGGAGPILVVGDRLDTDIEGAARLGWDSLLVLTGISTRDELARSSVTPTYVGEDLRVLLADGPADGRAMLPS